MRAPSRWMGWHSPWRRARRSAASATLPRTTRCTGKCWSRTTSPSSPTCASSPARVARGRSTRPSPRRGSKACSTGRSASCRRATASASGWRRRSSTGPTCSSSTSRRRASTRTSGRRRPRRPHAHRRPQCRPAARDLRAREGPRLDAVRAAPGDRESGGAVPPAHRGRRRVKRGLRTAWTVARRELLTLVDQPTGYILLVVFVAVNDFLCFRQIELYGVATLRPMLDFLPWLLLFLVPAVTMRALAEDARSGTLEVVLAQPVTELELVLGKYLGALLFLWIALGLTLPIPLGLALGAPLQLGVVFAQYVGSALLTAGIAGVGLWASSVSKNQVTAFILAVGVTFLLVLVGLDPLLVGLPPRLGQVAGALGVLPHFTGITRGVIDLRDATYFLSLAALFLLLAYFALMRGKLTPRGATLRRLRLGTALVAVGVVVVNLLGRHIGGRLDLTPGGAFTLSRATKQVLGSLPDLVTIKLFASASPPSEMAFLKRDVDDLLRDYRAARPGHVRVAVRDPSADTAALREARQLGIPAVQFNVLGRSELQVKEGYLGVAVQYAEGVKTIPFVQEGSDLEYRLTSEIRALTQRERPVVGLSETSDATSVRARRSFEALQEQLGRTYTARRLTLGDSAIAADVKVLVLIGAPDSLRGRQRERLETFFRRGGGALVMASGMALNAGTPVAFARPVAWNSVLKPYGVQIRSG